MAKVLLVAVSVGILAVALISSQGRRNGNQADAPPGNGTGVTLPAATTPTATTPVAWQYDAASNRHWDPNHGHWHDGPPPSQTGLSQGSGTRPATPEATIPEAVTPAPWQYDTTNNRHWNPDHGHWHDGPPPSRP